jgi:hypothetical protein
MEPYPPGSAIRHSGPLRFRLPHRPHESGCGGCNVERHAGFVCQRDTVAGFEGMQDAARAPFARIAPVNPLTPLSK